MKITDRIIKFFEVLVAGMCLRGFMCEWSYEDVEKYLDEMGILSYEDLLPFDDDIDPSTPNRS